MDPAPFPLLLPGLDAPSSEWVLFSALWLLAGVATFARFYGLATGTLTARLQATAAGRSLWIPGILLIFLAIVGHFAVMAAIVAETGNSGPLADLAQSLGEVLGPVGGGVETLLPPLAALGRLHWDFVFLAWLASVCAEALLYPVLKASGYALRQRQAQLLAKIERKSSESFGGRGCNF